MFVVCSLLIITHLVIASAERDAWTEVTFGGRTYALPRSYFDGRSDEAAGVYYHIYSRPEGTPPNSNPGVINTMFHRSRVPNNNIHADYRQIGRDEFLRAVEEENKRRVEENWKDRIKEVEKVLGICPLLPALVYIPGTEPTTPPSCESRDLQRTSGELVREL